MNFEETCIRVLNFGKCENDLPFEQCVAAIEMVNHYFWKRSIPVV